jgi:hypothetical protein
MKLQRIAFTSLLVLWAVCGVPRSSAFGSLQEVESTPALGETSWRLTRLGWQDSSRWYVDTFTPQPSVELIHPLLFAALVLIVVAMALVWASSEWEYGRLFGHRDDAGRGTDGRHPTEAGSKNFGGKPSPPGSSGPPDFKR